MKTIILAGGMGTRLSEETTARPKPLVEIGGKPIIWHIMKIYSCYGLNDFIICLGYKGYMVKEYFANYFLHQSDVTIDIKNNKMDIHSCNVEPWKVTLLDTGLHTMTGGRIKRVQQYVADETFALTYGDGVGDINIYELIDFHKKHKKYATVTAVQALTRFGALHLNDEDNVITFREKPKVDGAWINGGFFILEPEIFDYINGDDTIWERQPLDGLTKEGQFAAYKHCGFWKPMDTLRDKMELESLWNSANPPWKVW